MKIFHILLISTLTMMCAASVLARGLTPPTPPYVGLGNAGDWLGSGPLTGFDAPLGGDWPGNNGGGSGNNGFGWNPSGSSGASWTPPSGTCACRCQVPVPLENGQNGEKCENHCLCISWTPGTYGPITGSCKDYGRRCGQGGTCCSPTDKHCYL